MKELFLRLYNGDMSAREEIISNNMKLVYYLVHKSGFDNTDELSNRAYWSYKGC